MKVKLTIPVLCVLTIILFCQCQSQAISSVTQKVKNSQDKQFEDERGRFLSRSVNSQADVKISGEVLKAMSEAINAFQANAEILPRYKQIQNYDIEVRQSTKNYYIYLIPKLAPNEQLTPGAGTSLGRDVTFEVSKSDFKVTSFMMYK